MKSLPVKTFLPLVPFLVAAQVSAYCPGDCNHDENVTVDELVRGVNIALGTLHPAVCEAVDRNADGVVKVDELVAAVVSALEGCPPEFPPAVARKITDPADLIGGPLAVGRTGDYLLANSRIRVIIRDVGRAFSWGLTYGGNIVDADLVRAEGQPGRDNFGALAPVINIASTVNVQEITVINDGSDGRPAVIRTLGVDDLFDPVDPTNAIRSFGVGSVPASARDRDLPIQVMTEYALAPGSSAVRIETTVKNEGNEDLLLYVGDLVNGSGELDTFVPSLGFGDPTVRLEMPYLAYTGVGSAAGLSYGVIPEALSPGDLPASAFGQSGLTFYFIGQDVLTTLLFGAPGAFAVPAGGSASFVRHFVVGSGDVGSIAAEYSQLMQEPLGTISGRVTVAGEPAAGAVVAVVRKPGEEGARFNVINSFRTDDTGRYRGTVPPGDYLLLAKLPGHAYDSGTSAPDEHPVTIVAGGESVQDFAIPASGLLRVLVFDDHDEPIPARVTVVGFDPAPDPQNKQNVAILTVNAFVFGSPFKEKGQVLFGVTDVVFVGASGDSGPIPLPPGEYEVFVTRGPEYSAYRQRETIASQTTTTVNARLVRVVDTAGFVSADFHVHMLNSMDAQVTEEERIRTMAGEGVEFFVASDHDFLTDLEPQVSSLGLQAHVKTAVSDEITSHNFGHFNAWPLVRDANSITGGAPDWGRAGVAPGMDYPSLGSYDLSPAELFAEARRRFPEGPESGVLQINHINDASNGFFELLGIDTALAPPRSFTNPTLIRQDPRLTNLYDDDYDALELWIESNRAQTALLLQENLGDWFNLLNQGRVKTGLSDSDSHSLTIIQAGAARNFVASPTDSPAEIRTADVVAAVRTGKSIGSNGPFLRFAVTGDDDKSASLEFGAPTLVPATRGSATIQLDIASAAWVDFDTVEIYANAVPAPEPDRNYHGVATPRYAAEPTLTLTSEADFVIETTVLDPEVPGAARREAHLEIPLPIDADTWVLVLVKGTDGVSRPLWPVNLQDLRRDSNMTLADLLDGNAGEEGNPALAFTNPLFVDHDGNGRFDPPLAMP